MAFWTLDHVAPQVPVVQTHSPFMHFHPLTTSRTQRRLGVAGQVRSLPRTHTPPTRSYIVLDKPPSRAWSCQEDPEHETFSSRSSSYSSRLFQQRARQHHPLLHPTVNARRRSWRSYHHLHSSEDGRVRSAQRRWHYLPPTYCCALSYPLLPAVRDSSLPQLQYTQPPSISRRRATHTT